VSEPRFSGFAGAYDTYRPVPPAALIDLLCERAGRARPALVVDLGCGTGLSTRIWAERAERVVGLDLSEDMLAEARRRGGPLNVEYRRADATATGLPDRSVDVLTCCQAFHWMDAAPTLAEVARVLRPGGVFAAIDADYPPMVDPALTAAFIEVGRCAIAVLPPEQATGMRTFLKARHLDRMRESGAFATVEEVAIAHETRGDADAFAGLATTVSDVALALKAGLPGVGDAVEELRRAARARLGDAAVPWRWTTRVRFGVTPAPR
jgi:ubiquinone/menaquinone biosynthesis C-methylase UbiE